MLIARMQQTITPKAGRKGVCRISVSQNFRLVLLANHVTRFKPNLIWKYVQYLLQDILIACPADQREGEDEDISTPVAERPQPAVILLTCTQGRSRISDSQQEEKETFGRHC